MLLRGSPWRGDGRSKVCYGRGTKRAVPGGGCRPALRCSVLAGEERAADREVTLVAADADAVQARGDYPAAGGGLVVAQVLVGQLECDPLALAGSKGYLLEALELVRRLAGGGGVGELQLCDLGVRPVTAVDDGDRGRGLLRRRVNLE